VPQHPFPNDPSICSAPHLQQPPRVVHRIPFRCGTAPILWALCFSTSVPLIVWQLAFVVVTCWWLLQLPPLSMLQIAQKMLLRLERVGRRCLPLGKALLLLLVVLCEIQQFSLLDKIPWLSPFASLLMLSVVVYILIYIWPLGIAKTSKKPGIGAVYRVFRTRESFERLLPYWRQQWRDAQGHPRRSSRNRLLAQFSAHRFIFDIVPDLKEAIATAEKKFRPYQRRMRILYRFLRGVLFLGMGFLSYFTARGLTIVLGDENLFLSWSGDIVWTIPFIVAVLSQFKLRVALNVGLLYVIFCTQIYWLSFSDRFLQALAAQTDWLSFMRLPFSAVDLQLLEEHTKLFSLLIIHLFLYRSMLACLRRLFNHDNRGENELLTSFAEILAAALQRLEEMLQEALEQFSAWLCGYLQSFIKSFLQRWRGCTSAGGMPASSEQYRLSLLAARLSTLWGVRSTA
jgi:hypothetical protein